MSTLDDIQRKLYQPGYKNTENQPGPLESSPGGDLPHTWSDIPEKPKTPHKITFFVKIALGIFILGGIAALAALYFGFNKQDLTVAIFAKEEIESGEKVTYGVTYKNNGSGTLHDVTLSFTYPEGALPLRGEAGEGATAPRSTITLEDIPPRGEAKLELEARLFGKRGDTEHAEAVISYRPERSTTSFSARTSFDSLIIRVPLALSVSIPDQVVRGQNVDLIVDYSLTGESPFDDLSLGIDYPSGFTFFSADKEAVEGNHIWRLGTLKPGDSGKLTIHGKVEGSPAEIKAFTAEIGHYNRNTRQWDIYETAVVSTKVLTPLLSITQTVAGSRTPVVSPGDQMDVVLHYVNTLDIPLKSVSVEVKLESPLVDLASLAVIDGAFNGASQSIIWNGVSHADFVLLPAHAEGNLEFRVRLLNTASSPDAKNLQVISDAKIHSRDEPSGLKGVELSSEDVLTAKVSTKLTLSSRLLYHSPTLRTSGPLPPKVGKKTTYATLWQLSNSFNDLDDVEVRAKLSPGASWENIISPEGAPISYDPGTGTIIWRAGKIPAGTGLKTASPFVTFLVGIVPGENAIGDSPSLIEGIQITAIDTFTGEHVQLTGGDLTTRLSSDPTTVESDWRVAR